MSKFKVEKKECITIDASDFNDFVESKYGGSFEFEAIAEAHRHKYDYDAPHVSNFPYEKKTKEQIRSGHYPTYCMSALLSCLVEDGHLEDVDLVIDNR